MAIPDAIWSQLLANTAASGQSFNPWALGESAHRTMPGVGLEELINEARSRLSGQWPPPASPATPRAAVEEPESVSEFGGEAPTAAGLARGAAYGYNPDAARLGLSFLGQGAMLAPAAQLGLRTAGGIISANPFGLNDLLSELAPFGIMLDDPTPAAVTQTARDTPGLLNAALGMLGFGGVPTGVSFMDEFGMPGNTFDIGVDRTTETGITPGFSQSLSGGRGVNTEEGSIVAGRGGLPGSVVAGRATGNDPDPAGQKGDETPGPTPGQTPDDTGLVGPSGQGEGTGGAAGPGAGSASGDSSTGGDPGGSTYHHGGKVKGKRGAEKKVKVRPGEFILNENATSAYGPMLDEMNRSVPANLDDIMAKARKFWDV